MLGGGGGGGEGWMIGGSTKPIGHHMPSAAGP